MFRILVVCTGNVCRSPMAEVMLRQQLQERLKDRAEDLSVSSAGTLGLIGEPIQPQARDLLLADLPGAQLRRGPHDLERDVFGFRARRLEPELLDGVDLVLGAAREHRSAAVGMAPHLVCKAFTVLELARLAGPAALATRAHGDADPPPDVHGRLLAERAAALRATVRPLHAAADDVPDPFGHQSDKFEQVAAQLRAAVELIVDGLAGR
jgi:protein-tyrosine phosphatase